MVDSYHKRKVGSRTLSPETQMMGYGFDPALSEAADLQSVSVAHAPEVEDQCIRERYVCNPSGSVEVEISNTTSGYTRRYRLGRWAGKDAPIVPGKKRKSKAEAR